MGNIFATAAPPGGGILPLWTVPRTSQPDAPPPVAGLGAGDATAPEDRTVVYAAAGVAVAVLVVSMAIVIRRGRTKGPEAEARSEIARARRRGDPKRTA